MQKDVTLSVRIIQADKDKLMEFAAKKDVPASQIIREAIKKYIKEEN